MSIHLRPDQETELRHYAQAMGRDPDELVAEAVARFLEHQGRRAELLAELDEAEAEFARGEFTEYTAEGLHELTEDVKRRGRERLTAQGPQSP
jgi:predicted transcriptional regulator